MGICTSKPSTKPNISIPGPNSPPPDFLTLANSTSVPTIEPVEDLKSPAQRKQDGTKSPFFSWYSPSPAHYLFSKKSPVRSPANASSNSTSKRLFKRPFPPTSPAKHIKAVLARRHGTVKPNEASVPEGDKAENVGVAGLDKSFGFLKNLVSKYELGEEVGRGHFGYTRVAIAKKGELKGQKVAVKIIPKAKHALGYDVRALQCYTRLGTGMIVNTVCLRNVINSISSGHQRYGLVVAAALNSHAGDLRSICSMGLHT